MELLSDEVLLETYYKAIELHLESGFIQLLETEIYRRNLSKQFCKKITIH